MTSVAKALLINQMSSELAEILMVYAARLEISKEYLHTLNGVVYQKLLALKVSKQYKKQFWSL